MPTSDLPTEALALAWAVHLGTATWEEVVAWADGWILRLEVFPEELLGLSLAGRRPDEAWTLLRRLAQKGDPAGALSLLARGLLRNLDVGQVEAAFLAGSLEGLERLSDAEVPDDVRLSMPLGKFVDAARHLGDLLEPWNPEFTPDVTVEVTETLQRFL